jgi:signal recognition particle receptor subunit beta
MLGFVLLVDAEDQDSFEDAKSMISFFRNMSDVPFVVAANKVPATDVKTLRSVRAAIDLAEDVPLLSVDSRDRESVKAVLLGLLYRILDSMG